MDTPADSSRDTHTQLSAIDLSTSSQQREGSPEVTSLSQLPEGISLSQFPEVASLSQLPEATSLSQLQSGQRLPTTPPSMESVCDSPESESEYYSFNDEPDSIDNIPSDVVQAQDTASSTSRAAQDPHELIVMSSVTPVDLPVCGNTPEGIAHSRVDDSIASRTRSSDGKTTSKDNTSGHSRYRLRRRSSLPRDTSPPVAGSAERDVTPATTTRHPKDIQKERVLYVEIPSPVKGKESRAKGLLTAYEILMNRKRKAAATRPMHPTHQTDQEEEEEEEEKLKRRPFVLPSNNITGDNHIASSSTAPRSYPGSAEEYTSVDGGEDGYRDHDVECLRDIWKKYKVTWPLREDRKTLTPVPYSDGFIFGTALPLPRTL